MKMFADVMRGGCRWLVVAMVVVVAGAGLIETTFADPPVLSEGSGDWDDGATWSDGLAARAGSHYVVRSGHALSTPTGSGTQRFPGESLTLGDASTQGRLTLTRGSTTGSRTTEFKELTILDGRLSANNWATLHTVQTDSGGILVGHTLNIFAESSDGQQRAAGIILDASLSGSGVSITAQARDNRP